MNIEGIKKIINIRAAMNKKLINKLNKYFSDIVPLKIPFVYNDEIKDPYWLLGFVDAEGCFYIKPIKIKSNIVNFSLVFIISQHSRDLLLMNKIIKYLQCGLVELPSLRKEVRFVVYKYSDHLDKIIPFFSKYKLLSCKRLDFNDFYKVFNIIKEKKRNKLNEEDILKIQFIKLNMNKNRKTYTE